MSTYRVEGESLTSIADEIRTLSGTTESMGLDAMKTNLTDANSELADQSTLIGQILTALEGKSAGGGSGSASITEGSFSFTVEEDYEPMLNKYDLTATNLNASSRVIILILATNETSEYQEVVACAYRKSVSETWNTVKTSNSVLLINYNAEPETDNMIELTGYPPNEHAVTSFGYLAI